jgi:transcriptional regulator with XRE-family HTH domain
VPSAAASARLRAMSALKVFRVVVLVTSPVYRAGRHTATTLSPDWVAFRRTVGDYHLAMPTERECRRLRLQQLIRDRGGANGGQAAVARLLGKDRRQVSAWATGRKRISDQTAAEIAAAVGKPMSWMNSLSDSDTPLPAEPLALPVQPSQSVQWDDAILTEAERWVRFEEGVGIVFGAGERGKRFAALYNAILADGGRLSPEHCEQVIQAARRHGKPKGSDNDDPNDRGGAR